MVVVVEEGLEDEGAGVLDVVDPDAGLADAGADAGQEALAEVLPGIILAGQKPNDQLPVRTEVLGPRGGVVGHAGDCSRKTRGAPHPVAGGGLDLLAGRPCRICKAFEGESGHQLAKHPDARLGEVTALLGVTRDVTERKRTEEEARRNEARMASLYLISQRPVTSTSTTRRSASST